MTQPTRKRHTLLNSNIHRKPAPAKSVATRIEIATDGAITKATNSAGVGVLFRFIHNDVILVQAHLKRNLMYSGVTSQIAELHAIVDASDFMEDFLDFVNISYGTDYELDSLPVTVFSDSAYCINCFEGVNGSKAWFLKWMKNDWKNNVGDDVSNKDLWIKLLGNIANTFNICMKDRLNRNAIDEVSQGIVSSSQESKLSFNFVKVKGHSGHELNEIADVLAVEAKAWRNNEVSFEVVEFNEM